MSSTSNQVDYQKYLASLPTQASVDKTPERRKEEAAKETPTAKAFEKNGLTVTSVEDSPLQMLIDEPCKNRKHKAEEEFAFEFLISDETKQVMAEAGLSICDVVDYESINSKEIVKYINLYLGNLVLKYGKKFHVINAMTSEDMTNEFRGADKDDPFFVSPFRYNDVPYSMLKYIFILNADILNKGNNLSEIDAFIQNEYGGTFVSKNLKDCITHEYGHLLSYPTTKNEYESFAKRTDCLPSNGECAGIMDAIKISLNAEKNGRELLAETFTLYEKNSSAVQQNWKNYFNSFNNILK